MGEVITLPGREHAAEGAVEPRADTAPLKPGKQRVRITRHWLFLGALALATGGTIVGSILWRAKPHRLPPIAHRLTSFAPEMAVTAAAVSTGGKFIAYANPAGLFIQVIATGETQTLQEPAAGFEVSSISWFPDSARLLVSGFSPGADAPSLWIVSVVGMNKPVGMGQYPRAVVTPDGSEIAWVDDTRGVPQVQLMRADGGQQRTLVAGEIGETLGKASWYEGGRRLLFTRYRWNAERRQNFGSIEFYDLTSGKTVAILADSNFGGDAAGLAGGKIVYSKLLGSNPAVSGADLMEVPTDSRTGKASGPPVVLSKWDVPIGDFSATANGNRLVFRSAVVQHSVYVSELKAGGSNSLKPRRLTAGEGREDFPRAWTPDGRAVFIDSNRNGNWEIFKHALNESSEEPFVQGPDDQFSPRVSPDGAWLLYFDRPQDWAEPQPVSLMRVPISGGLSSVVLKASEFSEWGLRFECPRRAGMPCVLAQRHGDQAVFLPFDPATGLKEDAKVIARHAYDSANPVNWTMSPDGSQLAWIDWDTTAARIHVLPLIKGRDGLVAAGPERDVVVARWSHLHAIAWAPDGNGWFVATRLPASWALL